MALLPSFCLRILITFIKLYQAFISPLIMARCRFKPTCSRYGIEALCKFGVLRGVLLTARRVLKCHPLHLGGEDQVPRKERDVRGHK